MQQPKFVKMLATLHRAMLVGMVLFSVILLVLVYAIKMPAPKPEFSNILLIMAFIFCITLFIASRQVFTKRVMALNSEDIPVAQKLEGYRAACISRWAMLEGPALFCMIAFFITGNATAILLAGVMIAIFFSTRPTTETVMNDCNVDDTDIE